MEPLELTLYDDSHRTPPLETGGALAMLKAVQQGEERFAGSLGWHKVAEWAGEEWLAACEKLAGEIRADADAFVVVGIGGSNQAARAVVDALDRRPGAPEIIWAGNTLSAWEVRRVLDALRTKKSVYVNVIAKNFETLEPGTGFRTMRAFLREAYGAGWQKRVVATGTPGSHLEDLCGEHGFTFLPFPENVGGRYTALTPVGLLPMAAAGLDVRALAAGAADMERLLKTDCSEENIALRYAMIRNALYASGYRTELLSFFEPRLFRFAKWWVQLFGESEGKDGRGLFPAFGNFSEDLHSIGQFIQDGSHCLLETFLNVRRQDASVKLSADEVDDRFGYLDGMDYFDINKASYAGTLEAHSRILPCMNLTVDAIDEYCFGQLFYFFMFSCYLSGRLLGVDPFDQPGVEAYKERMFRRLGK